MASDRSSGASRPISTSDFNARVKALSERLGEVTRPERPTPARWQNKRGRPQPEAAEAADAADTESSEAADASSEASAEEAGTETDAETGVETDAETDSGEDASTR